MASDRSSRSAQTTFSVNIIGAGIAGLAAAIPLARKGHTVTIYESNTTLSELGAGLQLTPNATRVLYRWGLESAFLKLANEPAVMKVLRFADASEIGEIALNPQQTWEYGYPHWTCYRPDLQQLLAEAALQSGAKIEFGKRVADVDVEEGTIRFQNGMTTQPDLVVVADGISSKIREKLPGNAGIKAQSRNEYCIRTVIDKEKMDSDPETAELMKGQDSLVWCGPGVCVLAYTVSGGQKYNTLISCPQHSDVPVGRWNERGEPAEAQGLIKDFCPTVRKVWSYVDECVKWELSEVSKVESYASKSGRCVLVGDAAHAILPHAGQGGAMAIEDGAALAEFVSAAKNVQGLTRAMTAYQTFRQPRVENMRAGSYGNQTLLTLPDGAAQQQRDKLWGQMTANWKAELAELGEEGIKARPRPNPEPGQDMRSPESRQYISGYDVIGEAAKVVDKL